MARRRFSGKPPERLTPVDPGDFAAALVFGLRFDGRAG
jgi:hypothetical protein